MDAFMRIIFLYHVEEVKFQANWWNKMTYVTKEYEEIMIALQVGSANKMFDFLQTIYTHNDIFKKSWYHHCKPCENGENIGEHPMSFTFDLKIEIWRDYV